MPKNEIYNSGIRGRKIKTRSPRFTPYFFSTFPNLFERIESSKDKDLKKVLEHNRDEEKEHVAMLIEWMRKKDKTQDMAFKHNV